MVQVFKKGAYLLDGKPVWAEEARDVLPPDQARRKTIAYSILEQHNRSNDPAQMRLNSTR